MNGSFSIKGRIMYIMLNEVCERALKSPSSHHLPSITSFTNNP
jgi:hypothetical protein